MTQCDCLSLGLSSSEWNNALYASVALGSARAGLNEPSNSVWAFLTIEDAADPSPSLLSPLGLSPLDSLRCLRLWGAVLVDLAEWTPSGFTLILRESTAPFVAPLVCEVGSASPILFLAFLLSGSFSSRELPFVTSAWPSCSALETSAFLFLYTTEHATSCEMVTYHG